MVSRVALEPGWAAAWAAPVCGGAARGVGRSARAAGTSPDGFSLPAFVTPVAVFAFSRNEGRLPKTGAAGWTSGWTPRCSSVRFRTVLRVFIFRTRSFCEHTDCVALSAPVMPPPSPRWTRSASYGPPSSRTAAASRHPLRSPHRPENGLGKPVAVEDVDLNERLCSRVLQLPTTNQLSLFRSCSGTPAGFSFGR